LATELLNNLFKWDLCTKYDFYQPVSQSHRPELWQMGATICWDRWKIQQISHWQEGQGKEAGCQSEHDICRGGVL